MTIAELHKFAYRRLPKGQVHDLLHDWAAQRYGVDSLKACTPQQLRGLAALVNMHEGRVGTAHQRSAGAPLLGKEGQGEVPRRNARSGRRTPAGVTRMVTPQQLDLINTLVSELGWSESMFLAGLQRICGMASRDEIRTTKDGVQVITWLKGEKLRQKDQARHKEVLKSRVASARAVPRTG